MALPILALTLLTASSAWAAGRTGTLDVPPSGVVDLTPADFATVALSEGMETAEWLSPVLRCDCTFLGGRVAWQAEQAPYICLLRNPGFEAGRDGWHDWGGQFDLTSDNPHSGRWSARVTARRSWVCFYQQFDDLQPGWACHAEAWVRGEGFRGASGIGLHGWQSNDGWKTWQGIPGAWQDLPEDAQAEWRLLQWDFVPQAGWSYRICIELASSAEHGVFQVDDILLAYRPVVMQVRSSQDGSVWSEWSNPLIRHDAWLACPQGRFLQLRAQMRRSPDGATPRLTALTVRLHRAIPFEMPWDDVSPSRATQAALPDAPAGKHGFIEVRDGHLWWPDGRRARFWGAQWLFAAQHPTHEEAEKVAARYAKLGFNLWKWGGLQYTWLTPAFGPVADKAERLDRFDYLFAQLKKRGVYCYAQLDEYGPAAICRASQELAERWQIPAFRLLPNWSRHYYYARHPAVIRARNEYWKELWEHVNPYTGLAYRDDPAIVVCELTNENYLTHAWNAGFLDERLLPEPYGGIMDQRWNEYLAGRYPNLDALRRAWDDGTGEVLADGETWGHIKRLPARPSPPENRFSVARTADLARFYARCEDEYFSEARDFLRGIGVRVPIIAGNWPLVSLPTLEVASHQDVVDVHTYWDHPDSIGAHGSIQQSDPFATGYGGDPHWAAGLEGIAASCKVRGKPLSISEINWSYPNEYQYLFLPRLAAYAAFQDWDLVVQHAYVFNMPWSAALLEQQLVNRNNPVLMTQNVLAARVFREGLVAPAKETVTLHYDRDAIYRNYARELVHNTPVAFPLVDGPQGKSFLTPRIVFLHRVEKVFGEADSQPPPVRLPPDPDGQWLSDTGEIAISFRDRLFVIDAPKVQGVAGKGGGRTVQLKALKVSIMTSEGAVFAISLDGQPLTASRRMLLLAAGQTANSGRIMDPTGRKAEPWGGAPVLAEIIAAAVELVGRNNDVTVTPLDPRGQPIGSYVARGGRVTVGQDPARSSLWYELAVTRK